MEIKVAEAQKLTRLELTRILEIRVWAFISYDKVYSGAPRSRERSPIPTKMWKSTYPRNFGNHVTVRPTFRP